MRLFSALVHLLIDERGEDIEALAQSLSEVFARNKEDISGNIIEQLKETY
jgi:hypothetical protein